MERRLATFFSYIFHPMLMVLYAALAVLYFFPSYSQTNDGKLRLIIISALVVTTVLLPMLSVFLMVRFGRVSSMMIEDRHERNWPILQTIIVYLAAFYVLRARAVPPFIPFFLLGSIVGLLLTLLINLRWKISLHLVGVGGLCGGLLAAILCLEEGPVWLVAAAFGGAGIIGTSRLILDAHTPAQVYAGFGLGFVIEFLMVYFGLK